MITASGLETSLATDVLGDTSVDQALPSRYTMLVPLTQGRALIFNSRTQALAVMSEEDLRLWESVSAGERRIQDPALRAFNAAGFIRRAGAHELQEVEQRYSARRNDPTRFLLTVAGTLACNFGCSYCFQGQNKPTAKMTETVRAEIVQLVKNKIAGLKDLTVTWYGGEPLMDLKTVYSLSDDLIALTREHKVRYSGFIVTNGYFLTAQVAQELVKREVRIAQITIDGYGEAHDAKRPLTSGRPTFDRIMDNLEDVLANSGMLITIRVNVDRENVSEVERLMEAFAERGLGKKKNFSMYFAPIEAITKACSDSDEQAFSKLDYARLEAGLILRAQALGLHRSYEPPMFMGLCQAVRENGIVVLPTGDLHKCWDTVSVAEHKVGTIFDYDAVAENENNRRWLAWSPFKSEVCRDCKILPVCAGACAFKTVHHEETEGEAGSLPCPSWKFNMAERLFSRARAAGQVQESDWDEALSPTVNVTGSLTGRRHSLESVLALSDRVTEAALERT